MNLHGFSEFPIKKVSGLLILFYTNLLEISKNQRNSSFLMTTKLTPLNTSKPQPIIVFDFSCANKFVNKTHNKTADIDF